MLKFFNNKNGFSYVEIMTVVLIIMILSTIALANLRGTGTKSELYVSAQKIITDIHRAQNDALSSVEFNGESPLGGWGIYFDKNLSSYVLYADVADKNSGEIDHVCNNDCGPTSEESFLSIPLPEGTKIDRIYKIRSSDGAKIYTDKINLTIEPPDPITHFCEIAGDCDYDGIGFVIVNDKLDKREITVNFFGLVDTAEVAY